jgi:hypothetical protein
MEYIVYLTVIDKFILSISFFVYPSSCLPHATTISTGSVNTRSLRFYDSHQFGRPAAENARSWSFAFWDIVSVAVRSR